MSDLTSALIRISPFLLALAVGALRVWQGRIVLSELGWQKPNSFPVALAWWLVFVLFALLVEVSLYKLGMLELGGFKHHGLHAAVRIFGMVILAPMVEELIFRGVFLNWLRRRSGSFPVALLIQATVFVALHNFAYEGTLQSNIGVVQSFVDALLYGYVRYHTGSIFVPIAMHASGNAIAVIEMVAI